MYETLIYNGNIITLENNEKVEAILIENGMIKAIGSYKDLLNKATKEVNLFDLNNKTLIPSFIDPHSHITAYAQSLNFALLSDAYSFEEIINTLKKFLNNHPDEQYIVGFGYDQNFLAEKKHPTKEILDKVSATKPIIISHVSGHMGCVNSAAIKLLGINSSDGYLEESEFINLTTSLPTPKIEDMIEGITIAENKYLEYGITTVQDGFLDSNTVMLLNSSKHIVDIIGYVAVDKVDKMYEVEYNNNFKVGGYKLFLDGSPQGKTTWVTKPYENDPTNFGSQVHSDDEVKKYIKKAIDDNRQLLTHCNGDAAIDQFIRCYKEVVKNDIKDRRFVLVHSQLMRKDQLDEVKKLKLIPSYFVDHVYFWGDIHEKNFAQRAQVISPLKTTLDKDIIFTLHQDTPVIEPNMLFSLWCAVNRITKTGKLLGPDERISPLEALKAVTINAAYQYFEENIKGSIKVGKMANLVVLDKDPLTIDPMEIKDIEIMMTIKEGNIVYQNPIYK